MILSGLLDLANAYCEEALKRDCERIIRHGITTENAAMLYAVAIKYEATVSTRRIKDMLTESVLTSLFDRPIEYIHVIYVYSVKLGVQISKCTVCVGELF